MKYLLDAEIERSILLDQPLLCALLRTIDLWPSYQNQQLGKAWTEVLSIRLAPFLSASELCPNIYLTGTIYFSMMGIRSDREWTQLYEKFWNFISADDRQAPWHCC